MIFLAEAAPMPGSSSNDDAVAVFKLIAPVSASVAPGFPSFGSATVTSERILVMVAAGIPAFGSSSTDLYGRTAMIFWAEATPMPGNSSSCDCVAVFRSIAAAAFCSAALDCPKANVVGIATARAAIATMQQDRENFMTTLL